MSPETTSRPTQEQRRNQTRGKLLTAASELFAKHGFHVTHVMQIVSSAGVSAGTFYKYFNDKRAIFHALIDQLTSKLRREVQAARQEVLSSPPDEQPQALQQAFLSFFRLIRERRNVYSILLRAGFGVDAETDKLVWRCLEDFSHDIEVDLERAVRAGYLDPIDTRVLAQIVTGACFQIANAMITTGQPSPEVAAEVTTRFFLGGLIGVGSDALWSLTALPSFRNFLRHGREE